MTLENFSQSHGGSVIDRRASMDRDNRLGCCVAPSSRSPINSTSKAAKSLLILAVVELDSHPAWSLGVRGLRGDAEDSVGWTEREVHRKNERDMG